MLSQPRIYGYSTLRLVLLIVVLLLLGILPFVVLGGIRLQYALAIAAFIGFMIVLSVFMMTRSITVSDDGISTRGLLGESSLKWSEIASVSGSGNAIRLHNRERDVTVAPAPHLPGYNEVVEIIGAKRPDLFSPANFSSFSRSWLKILTFLVTGAAFLGAAIYLFFTSDDTMMKNVFLGVVILGLLIFTFMSELAIKIDGSQLTIRYLLSKTVLKPEDVHSIVLGVVISRTGRNYSIVMLTRTNRIIRFSGLGPSLPVMYLVLKNWHQGRV